MPNKRRTPSILQSVVQSLTTRWVRQAKPEAPVEESWLSGSWDQAGPDRTLTYRRGSGIEKRDIH